MRNAPLSGYPKRLDRSILEVVAETICGSGQGWGTVAGYQTPAPYRTGGEIRSFFGRAGVTPRGQSSTRKWFALESLEELNRSPMATYLPEGIEKVLLRLATPYEYRGDMTSHRTVIDHLNQVLSLDGLALIMDGVQPRLQARAAQAPPQRRSMYPAQRPNFAQLACGDSAIADILSRRWDEAEKCVDAGSYLSAIVMMGSILEGALLARVFANRATACSAKAAPRDKKGGPVRPEDWGLNTLIDVAHEVGWLQGDVKRFSHALRESRNIVHPYMERIWMQDRPDEDTCSICWTVVRAAAADLLGADPV